MVRHQAGLPGLLWEVSGTHPGAAPTGGGPPELQAQRGETLVLPSEGAGSKGRKEGREPSWSLITPFPTLEGGGCGSWDFPEQQKILGNQRQLRGGADSRPPLSSLPSVPAGSPSTPLFPPPRGGPPQTAPPPSEFASTLRPSSSLLFPQILHPPTPPPTLSPPSEPLSSLGPSQTSSDLLPLPQTLSPPLDNLLLSQICLPPSDPPPSDSFIPPPSSDSEPPAPSLSPSKPPWAERRHPLPPIWAQSHFSTGRKAAGEWEGLGPPSSATS